MHRTDLGDAWVAHHNGDYSGDVIIAKLDGSRAAVEIPFKQLEILVLRKRQAERISRLEQADDSELRDMFARGEL